LRVQVEKVFPLMLKLAGLPEGTPLQAFEEVKWEPTVMIDAIDPQATLHQVGRRNCCPVIVVLVA
jgi:hypothetical protein